MVKRLTPPSISTVWYAFPVQGDGTQESPWYWNDEDTVNGGTSYLTTGDDTTYDPQTEWAVFRLTGSTTYTFNHDAEPMGTVFTLYDSDGEQVAQSYWDDWEYVWSMEYTPEETGIYTLKMQFQTMEWLFTASVTPVPPEVSPSAYRDAGKAASSGIDDNGRLIRHPSNGAAKIRGTGDDIPELSAPNNMTSASNAEWAVSASSEYNGNGVQAWNAFRGLASPDGQARWMTGGSGTGWIQWQSLTVQRLVRRYSVFASPETSFASRSPRNWTLEGSDNGTDWTVLHTVTNAFGGSPSNWQEDPYTVPKGNAPYAYHRLNISSNYSGSHLSIGKITAVSTSV